MSKIGLIEACPGEWKDDQRAYWTMRRTGLEESQVTDEGTADVLVYLFNWEDGARLEERIGRRVPLKKARGYVYEDTHTGLPLIPTYHPALVRAGAMELLPVLAWDLRLALSGPTLPTFPHDDLLLVPSPSELREFLATPSRWLAVDIETPMRNDDEEEEVGDASWTILRASMARDDCRAVTFPWQEPFVGIFAAYLAAKRRELVGWNSQDYDWPRLKNDGLDLDRHKLVDAMWLRKFLAPQLPRGLGAVTTFYDRVPEWKSLSQSDEELYSAMDARETAKCYIGITEALRRRKI